MPGPIKLPFSPSEEALSQSRLLESSDSDVDTVFDADAADIETASAIALDTTLPGSENGQNGFMKRMRGMRRKKGCCVCCGINCSLFCKALGIITLLFFLWNTFKFARWVLTPTPTGLEEMPAFSTSLGCLSSRNYLNGNTGAMLTTIPYANASSGSLSIRITGGAPGTITLAPATAETSGDDTRVYAKVVVRAAEQKYLDGVRLGGAASSLSLKTPAMMLGDEAHCARFDMTLYVPLSLRSLAIASGTDTQVKFDYPADAASSPTFDLLHIALGGMGEKNMLIGSAGLAASKIQLAAAGGYVSGAFALAQEASLKTTGAAVVKIDYIIVSVPEPSSEWDDDSLQASTDWNLARLSTSTSAKTTISLANSVHRPLKVAHASRVSGAGSDAELRLDYKKAGFNGIVDVQSHGYSMSGVQSDGIGPDAKKWAGDKDGGDHMEVRTGGWVGLYF